MKRLLGSRSFWFLAERCLAQAGGLAFTALLVRCYETPVAAKFLAAYALASVFQPLFANACQPLAMRVWRRDGASGFLTLWLVLQVGAAGAALTLFAISGAVSAIFALVLAAPLSMFAAPLIAEDRWRAVLSVLIPASALGISLRLGLLLTGRIEWAALSFAAEPLIAGLCLGWRRLGTGFARPSRDLLRQCGALVLAMAATTLFWRAPVIIAEAILSAEDVVRISIALQIMSGFLLAPNAMIQSRFGMVAKGGGERRSALRDIALVSLVVGVGAVAISASLGEWMISAIYGSAETGAAVILVILSCAVGFCSLWRVQEFLAAHDGAGSALLAMKIAALLGMAVTAAALAQWPSAISLAVGFVISIAISAVVAPLVATPLRKVTWEIFRAGAEACSGDQRQHRWRGGNAHADVEKAVRHGGGDAAT